MTMLSDYQKEQLKIFFKKPEAHDYSDRTIAKKFDISQPTVSKYRKEYHVPMNRELVKKTINQFIEEIETVKTHWKSQQEELEGIKNTKKTIVLRDSEGNSKLAEIELEPMEKLQLIKQIGELDKYIAFIGSQEQMKDVIKWVREKMFEIEQYEVKTGGESAKPELQLINS